MKKKEFEFQYYYRKWLAALPILLLMFWINLWLVEKIQNKFGIYPISGIIMIVLLTIYYNFTKKRFIGRGFYYKKGDTIVIEVGKKTYTIDEVKEIMGTVRNVYSHRIAILFIDTGTEKIKIFSKSLDDGQVFKNSSIYGVYEFIAANRNLKDVKILNGETEYWKKKRQK